RRFPGVGRSSRAPAGPPRRSSALLDAGAEAAVGQLDLDALAGLDRFAGADELVAGADDRVAALERCFRAEGAQTAGALLELGAAPLEQQARRARQPLVRGAQSAALALEAPAGAALEPA